MANYTRRFSITIGGTSFSYISGFTYITTNSVATYYAVDWQTNKAYVFNQYWQYQTNYNLPANQNYGIKYGTGTGYFYVSCDDGVYKTSTTFASILNLYSYGGACYREIAYDQTNSKVYSVAFNLGRIDVFDTSCGLLQSISLGNQQPYGLNYYNGIFYVGILNSNNFLIVQNGAITKTVTVSQCTVYTWNMLSIAVDSFGYLGIGCQYNKYIGVYDSNGNFQNVAITPSNTGGGLSSTGFDASGRYIIMNINSIDIYY
jgi:hypothetical protein